MKKCVYILGPMRGILFYNFPAFDGMRDTLVSQGYNVCSPADIDRQFGFDAMDLPEDFDWHSIPESLSLQEIVRRDVLAIIDQCDSYACLTGWETSTGAKAEKALLDWLGCTDRTG